MFDSNKFFESKLFPNSRNIFKTAFLLSLVYSSCFAMTIYFIEYSEECNIIIQCSFIYAPMLAWTIVFINENKSSSTFNNFLVYLSGGIFLHLSVFIFSFNLAWLICTLQKI